MCNLTVPAHCTVAAAAVATVSYIYKPYNTPNI